MNLRQLDHLLAVADVGSFSGAADKLHLTQSALSRSIQALEADLSALLIDRIGKKNELTPVGQAVAARARQLLHDAAELRRTAELARTAALGELRIGLGAGPSAVLLVPFMRHMATHHAGVRVVVSRGSPAQQLALLRDRQLDVLAIDSRRIPAAADLRIEPISEMRAAFLCRRGHPLLTRARRRRIPFADVRRYPLACTPISTEVAQYLVSRYGPDAAPDVAVHLQCDEITELLAVVRQSDAIFLGVAATAAASIMRGELAELPVDPPFEGGAKFAFVTLNGRTEAPSMAIFRAFVRERLRDSPEAP
ncbi:MAG: LysR family transcriptional regulator [Burkholderiales bacterium]|nr:LysR family transcriptional regulator [Burkholderiales bacterium]